MEASNPLDAYSQIVSGVAGRLTPKVASLRVPHRGSRGGTGESLGSGVVFTGDVLFIEGTPVMWAGPAANWLNACDRILQLGATVLVPGHGPVTDQSGVRDVQRYLTYVRDEARIRFGAGMDAASAADDIDISSFADWGDPERIAVNVATMYREFDPSLPEVSVPELFVRMAEWAKRH